MSIKFDDFVTYCHEKQRVAWRLCYLNESVTRWKTKHLSTSGRRSPSYSPKL